LRYFTQTGGITPLGVFSDALPGHNMREHLLTAPSILVVWAVTHPNTNQAQRCLNLMDKLVPVCPTWQDAVLKCSFIKVSYTCIFYERFGCVFTKSASNLLASRPHLRRVTLTRKTHCKNTQSMYK
jgi:hypothetical protein